jgi:WD40 repeat protein
VVRQGEFTDISQIKDDDCNGGGQILLSNAIENSVLILDYNNLLGPGTNNIVKINQIDLETGRCKRLVEYQGSFDLFDLDSGGHFLAFGGEGNDDSVIIWDLEKQVEVCRTPRADFGRFVPNANILAVVKEQKLVFIDATTCQELRELNLSPSIGYETSLAFSPDGEEFAIVRDSIQIVSVSTGEKLTQIPLPENAIPHSNKFFLSGIKFSPNGRYLLTALYLLDSAGSGEIQLWQLKPH